MILIHFHKGICRRRLLLVCALLSTLFFFGQKDKLRSPLPLFNEVNIYQYQNELNKSLQIIDKAVKTAEEYKNNKVLAEAYCLYTLLFLEEKDHKTAIFYWNKAGYLLKKQYNSDVAALHDYAAAKLHYSDRKFSTTLDLLQKSKQGNTDDALKLHILFLETQLYIRMEKYEAATQSLNALRANLDSDIKTYWIAQMALQRAIINRKQNRWEVAIFDARKALSTSEQHGFLKIIQNANAELSALYEILGRYPEALRYRKALEAAKETNYSLKKIEVNAKTIDSLKFVDQNNEIQKLTAANKALSASKNRSELTAILASAFLTIISLLAVSLYRNNQIKLKTNALLHTKNKELKLARDAAVSAMKAKTNFLSTVTHELRTPLYAVTGLTHLLLEENPAEHQKEHLKSLKFSGEYLLNLINDILQINKIDADKREPLSIRFNPKKILTKVVDTLQQNAQENETTLGLEYDPDIPEYLLGDPIKLSQIFVNLVSNAIKFTKNGNVNLTVRLLQQGEDTVTLYFEVKDTGIGISKEQQQTIFDSFEQGSLEINREYGGTGLGLAIVKSLLGLFGSTIHLESKIGHGSTFYFEITLHRSHQSKEQTPKTPNPQTFDLKGLHFLVVEDNKINQVITKKMLTRKEMTCDIAQNGTEAIALAQTNRYDAILMDIHMPGIGGEEATRRIRKFDPDIPIIALTAISLDDSVESFYEAGCNALITKPFRPEVFYKKIGKFVGQTKDRGNA